SARSSASRSVSRSPRARHPARLRPPGAAPPPLHRQHPPSPSSATLERRRTRAQTTMTIMDAPQDAQPIPDPARPALVPSRSSAGQILRDYFVLTKPSIMLLLLITTLPAMVLSDEGWPGFGPVLATLFGGMLAAGGAGAVNMYIDRDID